MEGLPIASADISAEKRAYVSQGPSFGAQELTCLNNIRCLPHSAQICYRETSYEYSKLAKSFSQHLRASLFTFSAQSHLLPSCTPPP
jgi:hypothetical protein